MSRLEELPTSSEASLNLKDESKSKNHSPNPFSVPTDILQYGVQPTIPPHMQSIRSHTADEIVEIMGRTPLFMNSLEDASDEENVELEAIRALQYEGTPAENAQNFKEQGNEMVRAKKWSDAKEFYTKGLAVLSKKLGGRQDTLHPEATGERSVETEKEQSLEEACYVNRALCNLELKNYRSTILDCASTLRLNLKNVKAYYRSAQALLALDKTKEASDACQHGLSIDGSNTALKTLMTKIQDREAVLKTKNDKRRQEAERLRGEKATIAVALRARNIRVRKTAQPPDLEDASIHLAPDPLSPSSSLNFPVLLLYPAHAQSDFIKAMAETDTISQHLEYIFPLPWDVEREYQIKDVELYVETATGGLAKIGKNMRLLKMLASSEIEVVDEIVKINILPRAKAKNWIQELKVRKGK